MDDCSNDDLHFIVHLLLYGTKIILLDTDLTEIPDISTQQNIIKEVAIYNENFIQENNHRYTIIYTSQDTAFSTTQKYLKWVILKLLTSDSQEIPSMQSVARAILQPSVWKLHPKERKRLLDEFYLDREL